ncbi:MAG TPA: DMT family transporter [Spirochaetia bacterium]|nr:DMT family transporter [Spirochaetia bacterium]
MNQRYVLPIGIFFVSLSAIFVRLSDAPPLAIATYRMALATLLLLPLLLLREGSQSHLLSQLKRFRLRDLLLCLLSGLFLALHFATWIASVDMTSIASSTVLVNLQPIFVLAASALVLGERSSRASILFIGVAIAGCAILSVGDARLGTHHLAGDALALSGAIFVSGYMIIGRIVRRTISARGYTLVVYAAATIVLLGLDLVTGTSLGPFSIVDWLLFAALAVFSTLLGHSLLNWALKYLTATVIATSVLAEPIIATLLAIPIFGELPTPLGAVGGAVAVVGLFFFVRTQGNRAAPP